VPGIRVYGMLCLKTGASKKRRAKMLSGFQTVGADAEADLNDVDGDLAALPQFPPQWESFAASLSDL